MSIHENNINDVLDKHVLGSNGEKIGAVGQIFLDDDSGKPEWVTVQTGLFGKKETFVPIADAQLSADGLRVPYDKDMIKDAPSVDADQGHLSREEEAELYRHYRLEQDHGDQGQDQGGQGRSRVEDREHADPAREDAGQDQDTSPRPTGDTMTRSEERLNVGTRTEETGRARLRKYVVTEEETVTIPIAKEKVTLEREPITDANRDRADTEPGISEEEQEVVLREERPVVEKETVAVERVGLGTETVTSEEQVTETVRKEQIDTDGVGGSDHPDANAAR